MWQPGILWLHVGSDLFIVAAYYLISASLFYFLYKKADIPFKWMFVLFGLFIAACGTTHLMEVWTIWNPSYWIQGWGKFVTAALSFSTALLLIPLLPQAMALRSPRELETLNAHLQGALVDRDRAVRTLEASQAQLLDRTKELLHRQQQLQRLSSELLLTEQRERRRLAMNLHDYLGQWLVVAGMKVAQVVNRVEGQAKENLHDLRTLLDQSLQYARTLMADLSPTALMHAAFADVLAHLATEMKRHGLTVKVTCEDRALRLNQDHSILLYQMVRELLFNVLKHADVAYATVDVQLTEETLLVEVRDEGKGFYTEPLSDERDAGSRFGLTAVRQRLEAIGGRLEIDSILGGGTTARVILPLTEAPSDVSCTVPKSYSTTVQRSASHDPAQVRRVLIVDAHALVRQGILSLLSSHVDVQVVAEAASGEEAIELCYRHNPDVVLMDINMPGMNGIEATHQIKKAFPWIKVVGLSVNTDSHIVESIKAAGAADFVSKGSVAEDLYDAVRA
jgi:signal transduction histidine kinase